MGRRAETGPLKFGDDWPGVFIRGDNVAYFAHALDEVIAYIERQVVSGGNLSPIMLEVVKGLRSDLVSCDIRNKPNPQACKPFEECLVSDWGAKLTEDELEMVIAGTCLCGKHHEAREYLGDLDYNQSYVFDCSCGRSVTITAEQLGAALAAYKEDDGGRSR